MNISKNRLGFISAVILVTIGTILAVVGIVSLNFGALFWTFIYGVPMILIGGYMLFHLDEEDQIEQVKKRK